MIETLDLSASSDAPIPINFQKIHDKAFVNIDEIIDRQPIALSYGSYQYKGYTNHIPLVSYGNFMTIVGQPKSMKSFLKSAMVAGYIGGKTSNHFELLRGHESKDKFVIDIDTEQGDFHAQRAFQRVGDMVGANYQKYIPFALRPLTARERLQFLEWLIYESKYRDNIGLISIDGIADLVDDPNNLEESNKCIQKLMKWTDDCGCAVITVVHANFGSKKATGHLGSSIMKKSESVIFTAKEDKIVTVTPDFVRNYPFDTFQFTLNGDFIPYTL